MLTQIPFRMLGFGLLVSALACQAETIYRIDFSGTIDSGTLLVTPRSRLESIAVPFVPGGAVRGTILADLGNAPQPIVDQTGVHWLAPMSARLELTLPSLPDDVLLPIPNTFVVEESFGAVLQLQFATVPQIVFPSFVFKEPDPGDRNYRNEGNMHVFIGPGPGILLPDGDLNPAFAAKNLTGSGGFRVLKIDQTVNNDPPLFGLTEFYDLSVNFTATEASGSFVPEPATAALSVASLSLLLALRGRRLG